jgi:hypothetical protein
MSSQRDILVQPSPQLQVHSIAAVSALASSSPPARIAEMSTLAAGAFRVDRLGGAAVEDPANVPVRGAGPGGRAECVRAFLDDGQDVGHARLGLSVAALVQQVSSPARDDFLSAGQPGLADRRG